MNASDYMDICEKLSRENADLRAQRLALIEAVKHAIETIKVWHNMNGSDDVWPIYLANAPEMKKLTAAIAKAQS